MKCCATLLLALVCLAPCGLAADLLQIRLGFEGYECPFCARSIEEMLNAIPGVKGETIYGYDGLIALTWKSDHPFHANQLYDAFFSTRYRLKEVHVDVDGTIWREGNRTMLTSEPDGSVFLLVVPPGMQLPAEGSNIRIQGNCTAEAHCNILQVQAILQPV